MTAGMVVSGIILAIIVTLPQNINQSEINKKLTTTTNNLDFVKLFLAKFPKANIVVSDSYGYPNSVIYSYSDSSTLHKVELVIPVKIPDYFPEEDRITLRCFVDSGASSINTLEFPTDSNISLATAITASNCVKSDTQTIITIINKPVIFAGVLGPKSCPATNNGLQVDVINSTGFASISKTNMTKYGPQLDAYELDGGKGIIWMRYNSTAQSNSEHRPNPFNETNVAGFYYMANVTSTFYVSYSNGINYTIGNSETTYDISKYNDTAENYQVCHYDPYVNMASVPCYYTGSTFPSDITSLVRLLTKTGIGVSFEPKSELIYSNDTASFASTISMATNATRGSFWLTLGSQGGACGPSYMIKLVIT